jgi:hypothetical protein
MKYEHVTGEWLLVQHLLALSTETPEDRARMLRVSAPA